MTERFRYTPESVFDTFPWPQTATVKQIDAVAAAARELRRVRAEALTKMKGGLRALYRTLELPGANPLKDAHAALDAAVLTAYGFDAKKDLLAQLLALEPGSRRQDRKRRTRHRPRRAQELSRPEKTGDGGLHPAIIHMRNMIFIIAFTVRDILNEEIGRKLV